MPTRIIKQFMAKNRHKLPTSKEDLTLYVQGLVRDLRCTVAQTDIDVIVNEFAKQTEPPILDHQAPKPPKPSRRQKQ